MFYYHGATRRYNNYQNRYTTEAYAIVGLDDDGIMSTLLHHVRKVYKQIFTILGKKTFEKKKSNLLPLEGLSCQWIGWTGEGGSRFWLLQRRPIRSADGGGALRSGPPEVSLVRNQSSDLKREIKIKGCKIPNKDQVS